MDLITPFDPWKNNLCSCPAKYSLSAYTGCAHGCLYCYATSYIRDFSHPRPKKDFLKRLARELKKIPPGSTVTVANSSDPYQALEEKLQYTRAALEILRDRDLAIHIVTKSALVARDSGLLGECKKALVSVTLTTLSESLSKKLEPRACAPLERLAAIRKLSRVVPVAVRVDPVIWQVNTSEIKKLVGAARRAGARQIITSTYKAKPDNFTRLCRAFPAHQAAWKKLYLEDGEPRGGYRYLPGAIRKKIIDAVRTETLEEGLLFSSCREGFSEWNTAACDGGSL